MWCNVKRTMGLGSITFLLRFVFLACYLLATCDTAVNTISEINVARGKHTEQPSTWNDYLNNNRPCGPDLAVDGNTDNNFDHGSCTHTEPGGHNPYWMVDLGQAYWISRIEITNRNINQVRLETFAVFVGVKRTEMVMVFKADRSTDITGNISIPFRDRQRGRFVKITVPGDILTLCEVEVFVINIARGKLTKQSSTWLDSDNLHRPCSSNLAVDGNTDNDFAHRSCTHTDPNQHNPYWSVDLGQEYWITGLEITNRKSLNLEDRLQNFAVFVGVKWTEMVQIFKADMSTDISGTIPIPVKDPQRGRYVNITVPGDILTLCEVMVFGISEIVCKALQQPGHGQYTHGTLPLVYPSNVTVSCDAGYQLSGSRAVSTVRQCQKDGTWSGAPPHCTGLACAPLNKPENGHYDNGATTLHYPATAMLTCDPGYQASPSGSVRHCQTDGSWSGTEPQCTGIRCNHLSNPTHGNYYLGPGTLLYPSNVTVTCDPGYRLSRLQSVRTCQTDGTWSGLEPQCTANTCMSPPNVLHGHYIRRGNTTFEVMTTVEFRCDSGYHIRDYDVNQTFTRTCLPSKRWSKKEPSCIPKLCSSPPKVGNGRYIREASPTFEFKTSVEFRCDAGYRIEGNTEQHTFTRTCLANHTWSKRQPTCIGIRCNDLDVPVNGQFKEGIRLHRYPTIVCDDGFFISPPTSNTRLCLKNGSWSEPIPICTNTSNPGPEPEDGVNSTVIIASVTSVTLLAIIVGISVTCILRFRKNKNLRKNDPHYEMRRPTSPEESAYSTIDRVDSDAAKGTADRGIYVNEIP